MSREQWRFAVASRARNACELDSLVMCWVDHAPPFTPDVRTEANVKAVVM
jgi:hypothetical protein